MYKFKVGDKVIVMKEYLPWSSIPYALKGWKGTIIKSYDEEEYIIRWNEGVNPRKSGDLIKDWMIELIERKKEIKTFGIVEFCKKYY